MKRDVEAEELTSQLVRIESTDPGAFEGAIERFVHGWTLEARNCAGTLAGTISIEELEALPGRRCIRLFVPAEGHRDERGAADLTLLCHMDTVKKGSGWDEGTDPFGSETRDGKLYGRGSCDMKGGLACALLAARDLLYTIGRQDRLPRRSFALVCTVDEEDFMRGVEAAINAGWFESNGWVLDCEPTDGLIRQAHKGRTWFELDMRGVTAHASTPWKGADAIAGMAEAISYIRNAVNELPEHPELGRSTVTFGQIEGGYSPYVVPDRCHMTIDMRLVPPATADTARELCEEAIAHAEKAVPGCTGSLACTGDRPPLETHPDSPLLAALSQAIETATGTAPQMGIFTGYTDSAVVAGLCHNKNCMSYGPGSLELAHKPNEYVPTEDLARVRAVLSELLKASSMRSGC